MCAPRPDAPAERHNSFLQMLAEGGVISLSLYLMFHVVIRNIMLRA
jgi:O-antigen ligase